MVMGSKRFWCSRGDRTPGLVQCIVFVLSPPHLVLAGVMRPCFGGRYSARRPPWLVIRVPGAHILGVVLMSTSANDRSHFLRLQPICSLVTPAIPQNRREQMAYLRTGHPAQGLRTCVVSELGRPFARAESVGMRGFRGSRSAGVVVVVVVVVVAVVVEVAVAIAEAVAVAVAVAIAVAITVAVVAQYQH